MKHDTAAVRNDLALMISGIPVRANVLETDRKADSIILELKVSHTADEAVQQIKDKKRP